MFTRPRARAALNVVGAVAVLLALAPGFSYRGGTPTVAQADHVRAHPDDFPHVEEYTLGWPASPVARYQDIVTLTEEDGRVTARRSSGTTVGPATWSSATLALGVGMLAAAARLKPRPGPATG